MKDTKVFHLPWFQHLHKHIYHSDESPLFSVELLDSLVWVKFEMPWVAAFELIMDTALATMCEMIFRKARHAPGRKTVYAHGCVDAITALGIRQTAHPAARAWSDIRKSTMDEQLSHKYA